MPRPRTPTKLLEMRGAFEKNPQRRSQRENEPTDLPELGDAPEKLTGDQKAAWDYIASICPQGVLKQSDRVSMEIMARLYAKMQAGSIIPQELKQLDSLLGKFGMTPADRSKVSVQKNESQSPAQKYFAS